MPLLAAPFEKLLLETTRKSMKTRRRLPLVCEARSRRVAVASSHDEVFCVLHACLSASPCGSACCWGYGVERRRIVLHQKCLHPPWMLRLQRSGPRAGTAREAAWFA